MIVASIGHSERSYVKPVEGIRKMSVYESIKSLSGFSQREDGQGLAEYALILALIAVVAILALVFLGGQVSSILSNIGANI